MLKFDNLTFILHSDWIKKTMSDKNPGEKLGTSSHSNSMCSDKTLGYEDEKTDAGTFVCIFYCDWNHFVVHFKTAIYIFTFDV